MRKIVVFMETGYFGSNAAEFMEVADYLTDSQLSAMADWMALENAASNDIYPDDAIYDEEDLEELDAHGIDVSYNIVGWWEDHNEDEHGPFVKGGSPSWVGR